MDHVIPNGWEEKKLGDICEFRNGLWTGKKDPFIECNVIRNANFTKDFKLNYENVVRINVEEKQFPVRELKYGDLILEKSGGGPNQPVGRVVIFDKQEKGYSFSNFTSSIRIKNKEFLDFRFLYLYLCYCYTLGITVKMQKNSTGIRNLQLDEYKNIHIPFPNLSEQQRIVEKLDKIFAELDKEKAIAEQNLSNAKELFASALNESFTKNTETWEEKKLGDVCDVIAGQSPKSEFYNEEKIGFPFYQGKKEFSDLYIGFPKVWTDNPTKIAEKDDILMSVRAPVGPVNLSRGECCIGRGLAAIRCKKEVYHLFLFFYLKSVEKILLGHDGTVFDSISRGEICNISLKIPPKEVQLKIVAKIEQLQSQTQELEKIYTRKLCLIEELKQSVLHKAFQGEL